jgi:predicted transcriptional regulator
MFALALMKPNTNGAKNKLPQNAREILRRDLGSQARIARRLHISRSHVSMVLSGRRTSEKVRIAIARECLRLARLYDTAAFMTEHEAGR